MKTNILKIQRKYPLVFDISYNYLLLDRRMIRKITKLQKDLLRKANEFYGWEDDREKYDACIIAVFKLETIKKKYQK